MTSSQLDVVTLLAHEAAAGVFRADEDAERMAFNAATSLGYNAYRIDLGLATDKHSLLHLLGRALHFPEWYGENWDALADCLGDMSWAEESDGYLLVLQRTDILRAADAQTIDTLYDVLNEAVDSWRDAGIPMWVLLVSEDETLPHFGESA